MLPPTETYTCKIWGPNSIIFSPIKWVNNWKICKKVLFFKDLQNYFIIRNFIWFDL